MSDVPLLTSIDEMLETAQLQLAAIRFDHLSIDLIDNAPQAGVDREDSESTPIEITCNLGTRQEGKEFGTRFKFQITAPQWQAVIAVITDMKAARSLLSPLKPLQTLHRESRSWRRFLTFVSPQ